MSQHAAEPLIPAPPAARPVPRRRARRRWVILGTGLVAFIAWGALGGFAGIACELAGRALARRDEPAAARWLARAARLDQNSARAEFLRARLARRQNRFDDLRTHLLRAQTLGWPVDALEREQWLAQAQTGQLHEAEPRLKQLLTDPRGDGAEICEAYVSGYLAAYRLGPARVVLDAWEGDYPDDPQPWLFRGRIHVISQNWKEAEQAYRAACQRAPHNAEALRNLAEVLVELQRHDEALEVFRRIPASTAESLAAQIGIARCQIIRGETGEARALLAQLLELHPDQPQVLQQSGQLELEAGNYDRAVALLRRADQLQPQQPDTLYALASALRGAGDQAAARALSELVTEIREARTRMDRLVEVITADNDDLEARCELGRLQLKYGSRAEGRMWLRSVLEIDPTHAGARAALKADDALPSSPAKS